MASRVCQSAPARLRRESPPAGRVPWRGRRVWVRVYEDPGESYEILILERASRLDAFSGYPFRT